MKKPYFSLMHLLNLAKLLFKNRKPASPMPPKKIVGVFVLLITVLNPGCSQKIKNAAVTEEAVRTELGSVNDKIERLFIKGSIDSLCDMYAPDFFYLPEYKPVISEKNALKGFYADWFKTATIKGYTKKIYKTQAFADYVLEVGNFSLNYSTKLVPDNSYAGKYMIVWKRNTAGKLKILSEAFGCDKYIDPEDMPYAAVQVKDGDSFTENNLDKELEPEIITFDSGAVKAIMNGDGRARAAEFTKDGIYMPHFDPMQVGMSMLLPYMTKTYNKPGAFAYVRDTYHEVFNLGEFVFLIGHFQVGWDNAQSKGNFEGSMSNLMKRGTDGKLLIYCQLAHNDRVPAVTKYYSSGF